MPDKAIRMLLSLTDKTSADKDDERSAGAVLCADRLTRVRC